MKVLFLDTSSFFATVAIIDDGKVISCFQEEIKDDMASKIMPIVDECFKKIDFSIKDVDRIMVVNGPGSFTGVRISVTIAKVLAWSLKKDIVTISSLEFMATTPHKEKYIIPMIDARRGYVYAGVYDTDLKNILPDQYIKYDDLKEYFTDGIKVSHDDNLDAEKPQTDIEKIVAMHLNDEAIPCHKVNPNYLKKTEAEENLKGKND